MSTLQQHNYNVVPGFFIQDDPYTDPNTTGAVPLRLGLIDDSPHRWTNFQVKVDELNAQAEKGVQYKFLVLARHGQGYHNLAVEIYGTKAWINYWSKLNGDGNMTWGPDPKLTELGISQAAVANSVWKTELKYGIPLPTTLYCSPFSRAASTLEITFKDVVGPHLRPLVVEDFREINGVEPCNKRETKTYIAKSYPNFIFEEGFTEEDELWNPDVQECEERLRKRLRTALDTVFSTDLSTYISVTAHAGTIRAILHVLGHREYGLPTGGVIPVLVKATLKDS